MFKKHQKYFFNFLNFFCVAHLGERWEENWVNTHHKHRNLEVKEVVGKRQMLTCALVHEWMRRVLWTLLNRACTPALVLLDAWESHVENQKPLTSLSDPFHKAPRHVVVEVLCWLSLQWGEWTATEAYRPLFDHNPSCVLQLTTNISNHALNINLIGYNIIMLHYTHNSFDYLINAYIYNFSLQNIPVIG